MILTLKIAEDCNILSSTVSPFPKYYCRGMPLSSMLASTTAFSTVTSYICVDPHEGTPVSNGSYGWLGTAGVPEDWV